MTNKELREAAFLEGQKRFTSITRCKWDHVSTERFVSNNSCCECASHSNQTEKVKSYKSAWAKETSKKVEFKEKQKIKNEQIKNNPALLENERRKRRKAELKRRQDPAYMEKRNQYLKEYRGRPEVHEKILSNRRLPENREKARSTYVEYAAKPEVKADRKIKASAYRKKNKDKLLAQTRARQAAKLNRTPPWADLKKVEEFYFEARRLSEETGILHHVDHIVPLQSKFVSGLHVETNLRIVPAKVNLSKNNKFDETLL